MLKFEVGPNEFVTADDYAREAGVTYFRALHEINILCNRNNEPMNLPVASFSFLNTWATCPHQAARRYIVKDLPKEPESPEMAWGNDVHNAMEKRLDPKAPLPLADRFQPYEPFAAALDGKGAKPELKLGITAQGAAVGFWDGSTWLRGKLDAPVINGETAYLPDWKTGKPREDPYELEIGALLIQAKYPHVRRLFGQYVWLKELRMGELHDCSDTRSTFERVHKTMDEVGHAVAMGVFQKTPGALCGVSKETGRPFCAVMDCQHNKGRK